ncbi:similar to Saccharomyces cerevisiae YOR143C THI80 Thiamine pyrophosphokinase, phosphorylates thiamine to produce the coenzyme thiamine pyrophosphate (thiamine diphosphate) [Maudiozyma saulgeensis]|uniref:Thiamine pyrophosphokinase n=1 Tax=Maudiozyma saulgeensis TaxID=1789683 RepID=A0A1X7QY47_9SACH|nr:similar to Saccharomyces cerevisiae YOR143C THI80 Thiamine pyrophosphokinase, phosphorylates thiamine to produce the coenzyme thiamine pyrophosphate (thiamine diphosphate) [Kazachstania saulgeensis]
MAEEQCIEREDRFDVDETIYKTFNIKNTINIWHDILNRTENQIADTILILNQRINLPFVVFKRLWETRSVHVCADGATNRLYEYLQEQQADNNNGNKDLREIYLPDFIVGDLDSITDDVKQYYFERGVVILEQHSQYAPDFTKCVKLILLNANSKEFNYLLQNNRQKENLGIDSDHGLLDMFDQLRQEHSKLPQRVDVLALGAIGGRFDQTINSITELYNARRDNPEMTLNFLTDTDIIMLVPKEGTSIEYNNDSTSNRIFRDHVLGNCGLLPIGEEVILTQTYGLKWDIINWPSSIRSGRVSSNNRFASRDKCYIQSDRDIVMNIEYYPDKLANYIEE